MDETSWGSSLHFPAELPNVHVFLGHVDEPSRPLHKDDTHNPPSFLKGQAHGSQNVQNNSSSKTNIKGVGRDQVAGLWGHKRDCASQAMVTW